VVAGSLTDPVLTALSNSINGVSDQVISLCNSLLKYTLLTSTFSLSNNIYSKNDNNIANLAACSNAVTPIVTSTSNTQYTICNYLYWYTPSNDANITSRSNVSIYNSNLNIYNSSLNIFNSNSIIAASNQSYANHSYNSNLGIYNTNLNIFNSNNIVAASNQNYANHFYNFNLGVYDSILANSNLARITWTSNNAVFGCNRAAYKSNSLNSLATTATVTVLSNTFSNYRAKSASVPWTDFSSDGAGNDSLEAAEVTIGSAGLLMSGYNLLDKNSKLTNALSDAFEKMTIDPTRYFKLNDPGSYIDMGDSTTRVSKDRLFFKTKTFSNMILYPANLSYSNAIFTLCNQIALTATSISNLTHVSCSSNLTATGCLTVSGVSSNGIMSVSKNPLYLDDGNKGLVYSGALSTYNNKFTGTDGPVLYGWNGGSLASAAPSYGGNFAIRQPNLTGIAYWTSTGLGVFKSNPAYPLDVVGSAAKSRIATVGGLSIKQPCDG
jgi:hypothetical protein